MLLEKKIPITYIVSLIKEDLFRIIPFSIVLTSVTEYHNFNIPLPFSIPALLGTAISLVLSFKLSQSYERWWEARKIWGAIVNDSRKLAILLNNYCLNGQNLVEKICLRQIGWCYSLSYHLRKIKDNKAIDIFLERDENKIVEKARHQPLVLANLNGKDIKYLYQNGNINYLQQVKLLDTLGSLIDSMGQAERIKNTVFPKLYRLLLKIFIYIFILTLAIGLGELKYYIEVPLLIGLSIPFLLLEKTALLLQDPFENRPNDTPMTSICFEIEQSLIELINGSIKSIETPKEKDYYIL